MPQSIRISILFSIAVLYPVLIRAQSTLGEVRVVTDKRGQLVASAEVTITNTDTNQIRRVTTDNSKNYSLPNLNAGTYEVATEHEGFRKALTRDVIVRAREISRLDTVLEVQGTVTEIVVTAARHAFTDIAF